jgi:hypothetical protein
MSYVVASRRLSPATLTACYGADAIFCDVTSREPQSWVCFSPFHPHGARPA